MRVDVDIDRLLASVVAPNAPSYRALATTDLSPVRSQGNYHGRHGRFGRTRTTTTSWHSVHLKEGRSAVSQIDAGRVVLVETGVRGNNWQISPSKTSEPTPLRISNGQPTEKFQKIAELDGVVIYKNVESVYEAALYQHGKDRLAFSLPMFDQAIVMIARFYPDKVENLEKSYARFRKLAALALSPGTDGERQAAAHNAVKVATNMIKENIA